MASEKRPAIPRVAKTFLGLGPGHWKGLLPSYVIFAYHDSIAIWMDRNRI